MLRLMPLLVLALQEQQAKQLALISAGIGKMLKGQQKFEERVARELSGKQIKGEGEALGHVATYGNHPANGAPQKLSKSVTTNSNQFSELVKGGLLGRACGATCNSSLIESQRPAICFLLKSIR